MFRHDIIERLRIDPGQVTLGQLIQDREASVHEIERLRAEISNVRATSTIRRGDSASLPQLMITEDDSKSSPFCPGTLISIKKVCGLLGISRATIYRNMANGIFPKPIALGPRTVRWRIEVITAWVDERATK